MDIAPPEFPEINHNSEAESNKRFYTLYMAKTVQLQGMFAIYNNTVKMGMLAANKRKKFETDLWHLNLIVTAMSYALVAKN